VTFVEPRFVDRNLVMRASFYGHLFDRAGLAFVDHQTLDRHVLDEANVALFTVEQNLHCYAELREWDPVEVHSRLLDVGPRSFRAVHFMTDPTRHRLAATAEVACVCLDRTSRRAGLLPDQLRHRLEDLLASMFDQGDADMSAKS
jgi:acyl-CoA thioesterase FadM